MEYGRQHAASFLPTSTEVVQGIKWIRENPLLVVVSAFSITAITISKMTVVKEEIETPIHEVQFDRNKCIDGSIKDLAKIGELEAYDKCDFYEKTSMSFHASERGTSDELVMTSNDKQYYLSCGCSCSSICSHSEWGWFTSFEEEEEP
jgi:hypothetical protein